MGIVIRNEIPRRPPLSL